MLDFELNVSEKRIIVRRDSKEIDNYDQPQMEVTAWCIHYLKQHIYHCIKDLVNGRMQSYAHVVYLDGFDTCKQMMQKIERIYNESDWITLYSNLLKYDLISIMPRGDSRYLANFCKKRDDLIEILMYYANCKTVYRRTNLEQQMRMVLV